MVIRNVYPIRFREASFFSAEADSLGPHAIADELARAVAVAPCPPLLPCVGRSAFDVGCSMFSWRRDFGWSVELAVASARSSASRYAPLLRPFATFVLSLQNPDASGFSLLPPAGSSLLLKGNRYLFSHAFPRENPEESQMLRCYLFWKGHSLWSVLSVLLRLPEIALDRASQIATWACSNLHRLAGKKYFTGKSRALEVNPRPTPGQSSHRMLPCVLPSERGHHFNGPGRPQSRS